jgi:hypothetical protein
LTAHPWQGQNRQFEAHDAVFTADEVAHGDLRSPVRQLDDGGIAEQLNGFAEFEPVQAHAQVLDGELLKAFQFRLEDGGEALRGVGVVKLAPGDLCQRGHEVFVVGLAEAQARSADALHLQPRSHDSANGFGLHDPVVQLAVAEQQQAGGRTLGDFLEFIASQSPPTGEVGAAAGLDFVDHAQEPVLVAGRLEGNDDLGLVVENDEAEMILGPEVANGQMGRLLCLGEGLPLHGAAAVEHEAKGRRVRPRLGDGGRVEPDGKTHGLRLVRQDDFVIQIGLDGHSLDRLSC